MDLAALILSFASFGAAAASAVVAWFQRADAIRASERAEIAEAAATISAEQALDAHRRTSEALEALALLSGPPWHLEWISGSAYLLTNTSPIPALDVEIENLAEHSEVSQFDGPRNIGAKSAAKFLFSATMGTSFQRTIAVRWRRHPGGDIQEWQHPVPPKGS